MPRPYLPQRQPEQEQLPEVLEAERRAVDLFEPQMDNEQLVHLRQTDTQLFQAINAGQEVLGGMSFDDAVRLDPLRIEALVHQRIHACFYRALGFPGGAGPSPMGQLEAFLERNEAYRQLHGHLTSALIADSLERNWEQFSILLTRACMGAAGGHPGFQQLVGCYIQNIQDLMRGIREGIEIAQRAAGVAGRLGLEDDVDGWRRVATVIRVMGEFFEQSVLAPVRPGAGIVRHQGRYEPGYEQDEDAPVREAPRVRRPAALPDAQGIRIPGPAVRERAPEPRQIQEALPGVVCAWSRPDALLAWDDSGQALYYMVRSKPQASIDYVSDPRQATGAERLSRLGQLAGAVLPALIKGRLRWYVVEAMGGSADDELVRSLATTTVFPENMIAGRVG